MVIEKLRYYLFEFITTLDIVGYFSGTWLLLGGLVFYKIIKKNHTIYLFYYGIIIFISESLIFITSAFSINNHNIMLIFYLCEAIIFSIYYYKNIPSSQLRLLLTILLALALVLTIYNIFYGHKTTLSNISNPLGNSIMNNYTVTTISFCFILIAVYVFYQILAKLETPRLLQSPLFIINSANLIYFAGRFFTFLFIDSITNTENNNLFELWNIMIYITIIHRLIMCYAITKTEIKYTNNLN